MYNIFENWRKFLLNEETQSIPLIPWEGNPEIGWWEDSDQLTFYHGTHKKNLEFISENGIVSPKEGYTAGWVSLALEPNTAYGYASMSGMGGEAAFRKTGAKPKTTSKEERIVFKIILPTSLIKEKGEIRGIPAQKDRMLKKELYNDWKKSDQEYYALTEIRFPGSIPVEYITGYMFKK